jgi:hypothetical protein
MSTISGSTSSVLLALALIATALPAQQATTPSQTPPSDVVVPATPMPDSAPAAAPNSAPAIAASKVRIVRLSEVKGAVQLDRNTGQGFEAAMANLPIVEHARLQTGTGIAEVEFEDNSTLRIAPDSLVAFPRLELLPSGAKASTVDVLKGTAYVSLANTKGNEFTLTFGQQKLHLQPSSHVRLQLGPTEAKLAVMDGTAQVEGPAGTTEVSKKKTLTFNLANPGEPVMAKNVAPDQFDSWDHDSADYHKRYSNSNAFGNSPYSYGMSDMSYYGSFINVGGCGSMWRPYFVSAAWEPFSNGAWAWYPGAGYSWVSPYPWGWTPYHSGNWAFCQGAGWGWQPGGSWNGLTNAPALTTMRGGAVSLPRPPARPPISGQSTLVPVNARPLTPSALGSSDSFVFRHDSAGLGVPRGSLGRLDKFSEKAAQHGSTSTVVYAPVPVNAQGNPQGNARTAHAGPAPSLGSPTNASHSGPATAPSSMAPHSMGGSPNMGGNPSMGASRPASTGSSGAGRSR